jgi:hypothetical protein
MFGIFIGSNFDSVVEQRVRYNADSIKKTVGTKNVDSVLRKIT